MVFCCGLERETYQEISKRSSFVGLEHIELNKLMKYDEESENENENETAEGKKENTYTVYVWRFNLLFKKN